MKKDRPKTIEEFYSYMEAILTQHSAERIEEELRQLEVHSPFRIRMKVVHGGVDLYQIMVSLANGDIPLRRSYRRTGPPPPEPWALTQPDDGKPGFVLAGAWGRSIVRPFRIPFALLNSEATGIRIVTAVCTSDEWKQLQRFLRWQYPDVVPIYLTQKELLDSVRELQDSATSFDVRVREYVASERLPNGSFHRTVREWTDEKLSEIQAQVRERLQRIHSMSLAFYRKIGTASNPTQSLLARIDRQGRVELTGRFGLARDLVLNRLALIGAAKLELYSGRGLRERRFRPAPLSITFHRAVLSEREEVLRLLDSVKSLPNSMYSVQHGNPYIHVRVIDGYDGSGVDVWAISDNSVTLVPRMKSTGASLERLIMHLFENFREGEVTAAT